MACCSTRRGWPPWVRPPGPLAARTPPIWWPRWWMPMPAEDADTFSLQESQRIHIVGIGGAGMSAIALVLRAMGHTVTGSDLKDSPVAERLRSRGISVAVGHRPENVTMAGPPDALTYSPAVAPTNPELVTAAELGVSVIPRSGM